MPETTTKYVKIPVFTYGNMQQYNSNSHLLNTGKSYLFTAAVVKGLLWDTTWGFPTLTDVPQGEQFVAGELYIVTLNTLESLDNMEGVRFPEGMHERKLVKAITVHGRLVAAWAYFWKRAHNPQWRLIEGGDWTQYCAGD